MPGPFGPAWRTAMCSGPSTAAGKRRLRSLSLVLSLLFNPALSQTSWFEPKRLSTVPFGSTHFRGPDGGFQKAVLVPTPIQGFGNWSEPQDGPFSWQEDRSRPPRHFPWSALRCSTVIMVGLAVPQRGSSGDYGCQ